MSAPSFRLAWAVRVLQAGGVVAYPTEAVWGLGCDPWNEEAVGRLLALKNRPVDKGLILVAGCESQFEWLLRNLDDEKRSRMRQTWPGPVSWLVPHRNLVPGWISGSHDTVALRVSAHPVVKALCDNFGGPLVSTSANAAGFRAAREQYQLYRYFGAGLDDIVPGRLGGADKPSLIRDLDSDRIMRPA